MTEESNISSGASRGTGKQKGTFQVSTTNVRGKGMGTHGRFASRGGGRIGATSSDSKGGHSGVH